MTVDDLEKKMLEEILKNQFVFTHQLLVFRETFQRLLKPIGMDLIKGSHKCKILTDARNRTRKLLLELDKEKQNE